MKLSNTVKLLCTLLALTLLSSPLMAGENEFRTAKIVVPNQPLREGVYDTQVYTPLAGGGTAGLGVTGLEVLNEGKQIVLHGTCFGFPCEANDLWEVPHRLTYFEDGGWIQTPASIFFEDQFRFEQITARTIGVYHYRYSCYPQFIFCQTLGEPIIDLEYIGSFELIG